MTASTGDPGHLLPEAEWLAVVAAAELEAERIAAGHPAPERPQVRGMATGALPLSGQVTARSAGGQRKGGDPTFGVLHSAETPLAAGYAAAIARYFRDKAPTSCHYMTDPAETWGVLDDSRVAWHCGTGNTNSVALEQAGRASMTRAQWLVPEGISQMHRNGAVIRACRAEYGIGAYWMTDQQLRDAHARRIVGGWATHDQCRRVLGGTTHTDPGGGFPLDVQMQIANGEDNEVVTDGDVERIAKRAAELIWSTVPQAKDVDLGPAHAITRLGFIDLAVHDTLAKVRTLLTGKPQAVQVDATAVAVALAGNEAFREAIAQQVRGALHRALQQ